MNLEADINNKNTNKKKELSKTCGVKQTTCHVAAEKKQLELRKPHTFFLQKIENPVCVATRYVWEMRGIEEAKEGRVRPIFVSIKQQRLSNWIRRFTYESCAVLLRLTEN